MKNICTACGAVLEYDEETGEERCPESGEQKYLEVLCRITLLLQKEHGG